MIPGNIVSRSFLVSSMLIKRDICIDIRQTALEPTVKVWTEKVEGSDHIRWVTIRCVELLLPQA